LCFVEASRHLHPADQDVDIPEHAEIATASGNRNFNQN
jgi:hypothetical protein